MIDSERKDVCARLESVAAAAKQVIRVKNVRIMYVENALQALRMFCCVKVVNSNKMYFIKHRITY